jgi:hypothetical protein
METAAAMEIEQGCLRRLFLDDFHRCLEKPRTTFGFSTVPTGPAAINLTNLQPDRSFATKTGHFYLLPTERKSRKSRCRKSP